MACTVPAAVVNIKLPPRREPALANDAGFEALSTLLLNANPSVEKEQNVKSQKLS